MSEETVKCEECGVVVGVQDSRRAAGGWTPETKDKAKIVVCATCYDNRLTSALGGTQQC